MKKTLPEEVVAKILSWLPVESLLRFRSVSKPWLRLLTLDLHFINLHLSRQLIRGNTEENYSLLNVGYCGEEKNFRYIKDCVSCDTVVELELPSEFYPCDYRDYSVVGACNGLVCIANRFSDPNVYVWNPLTKDRITISCQLTSSQCLDVFGFGFDQDTNEYKIIGIESNSTAKIRLRPYVYTLGTNLWRPLDDVPYRQYLSTCGVVVGGALHSYIYGWNILVSFDLKNEVFQETLEPEGLGLVESPDEFKVGELDGLLCIFFKYSRYDDLEIWVMTEYGVDDSWVKQFSIGQHQVGGRFCLVHPFRITKRGEVLMHKIGGYYFLSNIRTNSVINIKEFDFNVYGSFPFTGSFVSPRLVNKESHINQGNG